MKANYLLLVVLLFAIVGCKNRSGNADNQESKADLFESLADTVTASTVHAESVIEENAQPFKGVWVFELEAEADEEGGLPYGRYEVMLAINLYEKSIYNGFGWNNGGFFVANDRHEGNCNIVACKVNGNEADIQYESLSGAIISAKLMYDPKSKSMTLTDGEVVDAADVEQGMINDYQILWDETKLAFKSSVVSGQGHVHLEGTLSKAKIKMALNNPDPDAKVRGHYCYTKYNTPILLEGMVENGVYMLKEYNNGTVTGTFTLTTDGQGGWSGSWSNGEKTLPVKLNEILL